MRPWSSESGCVARLPHAAVPRGVHAPPRQLGAPAGSLATKTGDSAGERQCGARRSSLAGAMRAINNAAFGHGSPVFFTFWRLRGGARAGREQPLEKDGAKDI